MSEKKYVSKTNFEKLDASEGIPDDESPEVTAADLARGWLSVGGMVIRGPRVRGRPLGSGKKEAIKVRIDKDVLARFRATGSGWQTRLNETLRNALLMPPYGKSDDPPAIALLKKLATKPQPKRLTKPSRAPAHKRKRAS